MCLSLLLESEVIRPRPGWSKCRPAVPIESVDPSQQHGPLVARQKANEGDVYMPQYGGQVTDWQQNVMSLLCYVLPVECCDIRLDISVTDV